jgi:acetyl esterase/lipase
MPKPKPSMAVAIALCVLAAVLPWRDASAGTWRETWRQRHAATDTADAVLPAGVRVLRDVAYGSDPRQRFDVYMPPHAQHAPVILLVHGGGWSRGDKAMRNVVQHKVARWVPRGFVVISTNYRMLPDTAPLQQAQDVARALALAQRRAAEWGGERRGFILLGHSAGAHLVALLAAAPSIARERGAQPWLGTVALDSAALDVVQIMQSRHLRLYDRAFGGDRAGWLAASPLQQLQAPAAPFLAVCSSRRADSCPQAQAFVDKAVALGTRAQVLPEDLSHEQINEQLGADGDYTTQVEAFLRRLGPAVARTLGNAPAAPGRR